MRLARDLVKMIYDIVEVDGSTIPQLLDPIVRPDLERRHAEILPALQIIRSAKESARKSDVEGASVGN
jgi:hypothetical protein